jgi:hypothetical protein
MPQEVTFNEFLEQYGGQNQTEYQALNVLRTAMRDGGWEIRHAFDLDNFMLSRPTLFYAGTSDDGSALDMNALWSKYRAAYPERVEPKVLLIQ